jgi:hypothetical protein
VGVGNDQAPRQGRGSQELGDDVSSVTVALSLIERLAAASGGDSDGHGDGWDTTWLKDLEVGDIEEQVPDVSSDECRSP